MDRDILIIGGVVGLLLLTAKPKPKEIKTVIKGPFEGEPLPPGWRKVFVAGDWYYLPPNGHLVREGGTGKLITIIVPPGVPPPPNVEHYFERGLPYSPQYHRAYREWWDKYGRYLYPSRRELYPEIFICDFFREMGIKEPCTLENALKHMDLIRKVERERLYRVTL